MRHRVSGEIPGALMQRRTRRTVAVVRSELSGLTGPSNLGCRDDVFSEIRTTQELPRTPIRTAHCVAAWPTQDLTSISDFPYRTMRHYRSDHRCLRCRALTNPIRSPDPQRGPSAPAAARQCGSLWRNPTSNSSTLTIVLFSVTAARKPSSWWPARNKRYLSLAGTAFAIFPSFASKPFRVFIVNSRFHTVWLDANRKFAYLAKCDSSHCARRHPPRGLFIFRRRIAAFTFAARSGPRPNLRKP